MVDKKSHWENVYQQKSADDVSWYQKQPAISLQLIHNTGLARDAALIDVGGGASVLVDYLIKEGYRHPAVLDISANALAVAKQRLADQADRVEWFVSDVTQFQPPHPFQLWHDRAVFHFLTDKADREHYIKVLNNTLPSGGHLIMAAFAIGGPEKCSGLDIVQYDADKLMAELGEGFELIEEKSELHITPADKEQKFAYFRFLKT